MEYGVPVYLDTKVVYVHKQHTLTLTKYNTLDD